jgi:hypothetical protein
MSIDEEQARGVVHITECGNGAEQNGAVAAIQDREAASVERSSYSRITASTISNSAGSLTKPA